MVAGIADREAIQSAVLIGEVSMKHFGCPLPAEFSALVAQLKAIEVDVHAGSPLAHASKTDLILALVLA